jgi:hypothetical protein
MARIYRKHPLTAGRVLDGIAFVITADDNKMHTLNGAGTLLWSLGADGITVDKAAEELVLAYEVDLETARQDVTECLESFVAQGRMQADG